MTLTESQAAALERLNHIAGELGGVAIKLAELIIIEDLCWSKIAKVFRSDPKTAKVWTIAALTRLAEII